MGIDIIDYYRLCQWQPTIQPHMNSLKCALDMNHIPARYSADWIQKLDGRTTLARVVQNRLAELEADLGGAGQLSYQERSLCRRAIWLEAMLESREAALADGAQVDEGNHTQLIHALTSLWRALGLKRRSKAVDLSTYLKQREA